MYLVKAWSGGLIAPLLEDAPSEGGGGSRFKAPLLPGAGAGPSTGGDGDEPSEQSGADDQGDPEVHADGAEDADREESLEDLLLDDSDDETQQSGEQPKDPVRTKLTKKNRKLSRRLLKQKAENDALLVRVQQAEKLEALIQANPRLRAIVMGDADPDARPPARREPEPKEEEFDESALPFDPNENPTNRYFADLAKRNFDQQRLLTRLQKRLDSFEGRDVQRTEAQIKGQWKSAIDAAVVHIKDEGVREMFKDTVSLAYREARAKNIPVERVIGYYLKRLGVDPAQAAKAQAAAANTTDQPRSGAPNTSRAAAQQRIAENNRNLPRTVAPPGIPAPARTSRETVADVNRRIRQGVGR